MTIHEAVVEMLHERFPSQRFVAGDPASSVIATVEAPYPELGRLVIEDSGDEVTVYLGTVTHGHFNAFHEPGRQQPTAIAELLGSFLEDLFSDRIVIYATKFTNGWTAIGGTKVVKKEDRSQFLWSRAIV